MRAPNLPYEGSGLDSRSDPDLQVGAVYFFRCKQTGRIKIGYSRTPFRRFRDLNRMNATELEMLGFVWGTWSMEQMIHRLLREHWIKGEWFEGNEQVEYITLETLWNGLGRESYDADQRVREKQHLDYVP